MLREIKEKRSKKYWSLHFLQGWDRIFFYSFSNGKKFTCALLCYMMIGTFSLFITMIRSLYTTSLASKFCSMVALVVALYNNVWCTQAFSLIFVFLILFRVKFPQVWVCLNKCQRTFVCDFRVLEDTRVGFHTYIDIIH